MENIYSRWSNFRALLELHVQRRKDPDDLPEYKPLAGEGSLGKGVEFEAKTTEVDPNRGIGCNTIEGEVMISDEVRFGEASFEEATSGRTRVDVTMNSSDAPAGAAGEAVTNILPKPERNLMENLENLTRNIERGRPRRTRGADPQPLTSVPVMG